MSNKMKIIKPDELVESGIIKPEEKNIISQPTIFVPNQTFADKINQSKIENREDLKKVTSNPLMGKLGKEPTPFERPIPGSRTIVICGSQVPVYNKKLKNNPDYWKDEQIAQVLVIKDEDYAVLMRKKYEALQLATPEQVNEAELVKQLGLTIDQNLTVS